MAGFEFPLRAPTLVLFFLATGIATYYLTIGFLALIVLVGSMFWPVSIMSFGSARSLLRRIRRR